HPEIRSPDPGTCPICYMSLEPIPESHAAHVHVADARAPDAAPEPIAPAPVMPTTERAQRAGTVTVAARSLTLRGEERWPAVIEANEGARAEARVRADAFVERVTIGQSNVEVRAGQTLAWVYSPEIFRAQEELLVAARWRASGTAPTASAAETAARERLLLLGVSARDIDAIVTSGRTRRTLPVRAPIGGHVTRFEAVVGSYVTPATVLYEIT